MDSQLSGQSSTSNEPVMLNENGQPISLFYTPPAPSVPSPPIPPFSPPFSPPPPASIQTNQNNNSVEGNIFSDFIRIRSQTIDTVILYRELLYYL